MEIMEIMEIMENHINPHQSPVLVLVSQARGPFLEPRRGGAD